MQTALGKPNIVAIAFFLVFVALTLGITGWAARRTRSTRASSSPPGGDHGACRTASRSPATT